MKTIMTLVCLMTPALLATSQEEQHLDDAERGVRRPIPFHQLTWQEVKDGVPVHPPQGQFKQLAENVWVFEPPTPHSSPALVRRNSR